MSDLHIVQEPECMCGCARLRESVTGNTNIHGMNEVKLCSGPRWFNKTSQRFVKWQNYHLKKMEIY